MESVRPDITIYTGAFDPELPLDVRGTGDRTFHIGSYECAGGIFYDPDG